MGDIFISYANQDRERARQLADRLQDRGYSVWWDRELISAKFLDDVVERGLEVTRCVLVLWSDRSVTSDVVQAQASEGAARGVLVPARLAQVSPPPPYRQLESADLTGWAGDADHPGLEQLLVAVRLCIETATEDGGELTSALIRHATGVVPSAAGAQDAQEAQEAPPETPSGGLLQALIRKLGRR